MSSFSLPVIAAALSDIVGVKLSTAQIVTVDGPDFKEDVADATLKFRYQAESGGAGFVILSGAGNPHLVKRATDNIERTREMLSDDVAAPVLEPSHSGYIEGRSFAVWPIMAPFLRPGKLSRLIRGHGYIDPVLSWNRTLCQETIASADLSVVVSHLEEIAQDTELPQDMRDDALIAQRRGTDGTWVPMHCVQHGDFWHGNLLVPMDGGSDRFYVIDWAGMQKNGYPFFDLVKMLASLNCGKGFVVQNVKSLSAHVQCAPQDATSYLLSALGHLAKNLEHFPKHRFNAMAVRHYQFLKQVI